MSFLMLSKQNTRSGSWELLSFFVKRPPQSIDVTHVTACFKTLFVLPWDTSSDFLLRSLTLSWMLKQQATKQNGPSPRIIPWFTDLGMNIVGNIFGECKNISRGKSIHIKRSSHFKTFLRHKRYTLYLWHVGCKMWQPGVSDVKALKALYAHSSAPTSAMKHLSDTKYKDIKMSHFLEWEWKKKTLPCVFWTYSKQPLCFFPL